MSFRTVSCCELISFLSCNSSDGVVNSVDLDFVFCGALILIIIGIFSFKICFYGIFLLVGYGWTLRIGFI